MRIKSGFRDCCSGLALVPANGAVGLAGLVPLAAAAQGHSNCFNSDFDHHLTDVH